MDILPMIIIMILLIISIVLVILLKRATDNYGIYRDLYRSSEMSIDEIRICVGGLVDTLDAGQGINADKFIRQLNDELNGDES